MRLSYDKPATRIQIQIRQIGCVDAEFVVGTRTRTFSVYDTSVQEVTDIIIGALEKAAKKPSLKQGGRKS